MCLSIHQPPVVGTLEDSFHTLRGLQESQIVEQPVIIKDDSVRENPSTGALAAPMILEANGLIGWKRSG